MNGMTEGAVPQTLRNNYRENSGMPKLPDAIHVVTAIRTQCRTVLSADLRLKLPAGYSVMSPKVENLARLIEEMK
jgi:hypothetical protein